MFLDKLNARLAEIEKAIESTAQSLHILQGHKGEVSYHIAEIMKEAEEVKEEVVKPLETQVEVPVE